MTIADRARACAEALREKNLVPSTRLMEVIVAIAASLEATEWKGIRELEERLQLAENVCYAVEGDPRNSVVQINVNRALQVWREGRGL